jgi:hypothetical protein
MASKNCSGFLLISYMMEMAESVVADYVEARHLIFDSPSLTACRRESIRWMNEVRRAKLCIFELCKLHHQPNGFLLYFFQLMSRFQSESVSLR